MPILSLPRHNDLPWQLLSKFNNQLRLPAANLTVLNDTHTNIPKLRQGHVGGQVGTPGRALGWALERAGSIRVSRGTSEDTREGVGHWGGQGHQDWWRYWGGQWSGQWDGQQVGQQGEQQGEQQSGQQGGQCPC